MSGPFISILTPAYNAARFLPALLESTAAQEYPDFEHVVIDDGSTDGTADVLAGRRDPRLRWYSRPNRGQYATQNELIGQARGEVITFICADDLYAGPRTLPVVARGFQEAPRPDVVFGRTPRLVMAPQGSYTFDPDLPSWMARPLMRHCLCVQHCSLFVRAELVRREHLYFDPSYRQRGDWDWMIRMFQATGRIRGIPDRLSYWRFHPGQTTQAATARGREETARLCATHGIQPQVVSCARMAAVVYAQTIHLSAIARRRGIGPAWRKVAGRLTASFGPLNYRWHR
jgi:glycosyltransferase involved in cell wall biosynthesis